MTNNVGLRRFDFVLVGYILLMNEWELSKQQSSLSSAKKGQRTRRALILYYKYMSLYLCLRRLLPVYKPVCLLGTIPVCPLFVSLSSRNEKLLYACKVQRKAHSIICY